MKQIISIIRAFGYSRFLKILIASNVISIFLPHIFFSISILISMSALLSIELLYSEESEDDH